jgi:multisubunit Na+/H+ antiporter MnhC subunit
VAVKLNKINHMFDLKVIHSVLDQLQEERGIPKDKMLEAIEMAFVLVAIVIFFALVSLAYFSIRINSLDKDVGALKEDEAKEIVKKISGVELEPEVVIVEL